MATSTQTSTLPSTVGALILEAAERHRGTALQYPDAGGTAFITYPELGSASHEIARGLIALGIEPGDRVAILGLTSAAWTLADCGASCAAAVVVPIYHTNSPEEIAYTLGHSGARLIFCDSAAQAEKVELVRERCPALEHLVLFDGDRTGAISLDELRRMGQQIPPEEVTGRLAGIDPQDVATIVYTSGTTGLPKGCMLTHENLVFTARGYAQRLGFNRRHTLYQFLPLAHVLARVAQVVTLSVGARIVYWQGDSHTIVDELRSAAPTHFPAVPRVYEKIHRAVVSQAADGPRIQRQLLDWAIHVGAKARAELREGRQPDLLTDLQYRLADQLVLHRVRDVFGPALELAMVGAAPVAKDLLEFFDACGVLILEGYGLTETCASGTVNALDAVRFGSVGQPLPGTQVRVAEDGELQIRGPHVFKGYYRDAEATEDALDGQGWLRTGDLGRIDEDGFVYITGRKKDLIITSSGKNISPVAIESLLRESRYVTEAVVFGDQRPYLVAMLTLDRDEAANLAVRLGVEAEIPLLAKHPLVRAEIQVELDRINSRLARIEQVKRFAILDHDLTQEAGELTPTLKVKRGFVYDRYADLLAGLYEQPGA